MPTAVVAFGGNAFVPEGSAGTFEEQAERVGSMTAVLGGLSRRGYRVVVTHGNGPQVGALAIQQEQGADLVPPQPLVALDAMTQGQLGHLLVLGACCHLGTDARVACVVTHVTVDAEDPDFGHPTKPIGPFFARDQAEQLAQDRGWVVREVAPDRYRRVVPSPAPERVVELDAIRTMVETGTVVVAGGGGGIPVVADADGQLRGVDAVVDKDRVAELLATELGAEVLVLITGVPAVAIDFGTETQRTIDVVDVSEATRLLDEGQFPAGSMGPKVEAAVRFVTRSGEVAVITNEQFVLDALDGRHGTRIVRDVPQPVGEVDG